MGGCQPGFDGQIKKSKFWKRNEKQKTKLTFFGTNDSDDFYGIGLVQICIWKCQLMKWSHLMRQIGAGFDDSNEVF